MRHFSRKLEFGSPDSLIEQTAGKCQSSMLLTIELNRTYTSGTGRHIGSYREVYVEMSTFPTVNRSGKGLPAPTG